MIMNRRKKMKKGGIVFGPDGEIVTGSTYKPSRGILQARTKVKEKNAQSNKKKLLKNLSERVWGNFLKSLKIYQSALT